MTDLIVNLCCLVGIFSCLVWLIFGLFGNRICDMSKTKKRFVLNMDSTIRIMQKLKVKMLLQKFKGEK